MLRACALALGCLLLAGCVSLGRKAPAATAEVAKQNATAIASSSALVVGRIVSIEPSSLSVMVEVGSFAVLPPDFATRILIARTDGLSLTARLQSSAYIRGRILGTRLIEGAPHVGDEVVCTPAKP